MGKSFKENKWKKNFGNSKKNTAKHRGKSNKELELMENGFSEDDMDLSYQDNTTNQFGEANKEIF